MAEEWHERAACRGADSSLFYPDKGQPTAQARRICAGCPVIEACLKAAVERGDRWGIFGGLTYPERKRLRLEGQEAA